jgi:hypothetical protein
VNDRSAAYKVTGRWARLSDGRTVTAILPYNADWDAGRLDNEVARFQADPARYLNTHPLINEVAS